MQPYTPSTLSAKSPKKSSPQKSPIQKKKTTKSKVKELQKKVSLEMKTPQNVKSLPESAFEVGSTSYEILRELRKTLQQIGMTKEKIEETMRNKSNELMTNVDDIAPLNFNYDDDEGDEEVEVTNSSSNPAVVSSNSIASSDILPPVSKEKEYDPYTSSLEGDDEILARRLKYCKRRIHKVKLYNQSEVQPSPLLFDVPDTVLIQAYASTTAIQMAKKLIKSLFTVGEIGSCTFKDSGRSTKPAANQKILERITAAIKEVPFKDTPRDSDVRLAWYNLSQMYNKKETKKKKITR